MTVEHHEKFHQRERRLGLPVFVARKGIGPPPCFSREINGLSPTHAEVFNQMLNTIDKI
jgi:hypothetical protein